ncbi:MAG: hypothetical protein JNM64_06470 [Chloroflexia bacterium]|nr:hypothetical protein [Chloroflexia bacterium]
MRFAPDADPVSAFIFDMGGRLVDSEAPSRSAFARLAEAVPWLAAQSVGCVAR